MDWQAQRVIVTGGAGFLGSAVCGALRARGVATDRLFVARSREFDLTTRQGARRLLTEPFGAQGPGVVIHCAGAVGGLQANKDQPGRFFFENAAMAMNLIEEFRLAGLIERGSVFVQIGSMTSYPAGASIPFKEESLWSGYPDAASAPYAVAKLAAWQMLEAYTLQYGMKSSCLIPVNLYGPGDNIADVRNAHVAGSLVKRFVDAVRDGTSEVVCWGDGSPTREFLYIDDAASGVVRAAEVMREPTPINLGSGQEVSIRQLAETIAKLAGFAGRIVWDTTKPGGQPRRCTDVSRARTLLNWQAQTRLEDGLRNTIAWYQRTAQ